MDDDVLLAAKQRAGAEGVTVGEALSAMARESLRTRAKPRDTKRSSTDSTGHREVTPETVKSLLDEVT